MDIRKYLCDWEFSDDFIQRIDTFAVWRNNVADLGNALFVMKNRDIYAAGDIIERCRNDSTLADSGTKTNVHEPMLLCLLNGKKIKKFVFGISQVFICTEEGEVFGYGYRRNYNAAPSQYVLPQKVSELQGLRVIDMAMGPRGQCLALCDNGKIRVFEFGLLKGYLINTSSVADAKPLNILHVAEDSYVSLLENGKVMRVEVNINDPLVCEVMSFETADHGKIKKVITGPYALDEYGHLFVISRSMTDEKLRLYKSDHNSTFGEKIIDIAASRFCSLRAALTESGKVYMWGKGRGASILKPMLTPFRSLHEVFLHYSMPLVTYEMVNVREFSPLEPMNNFNIAGPQTKQDKYTMTEAQNLFIDTFKEAFDDPKFCDLFIVVEGKTIPVHRSVLSLRCGHFAEVFQKQWPDEKPCVLEIDDGDFKVYKAFLKYLYTDQLDTTLSFNEMIELLNLANKYNSKSLAERCAYLVQSNITAKNLVSLYERVAVMSKTTTMKNIFDQLKDSCVKFTADNETDVVISDEFAKLDSNMAKELIVEVCKKRIFKN
ncbi:RCC1 and BTB domain-containing protein 1-like [Planococcus citri]|uniref:RCC1 and BTB domain-containing protein 1-like n=1 Tax=Planococcus citri TaxID=170843 RepID=UPI0031F7B4C8